MAEQIIILTPVFNDGASLNILLGELAVSLTPFNNSTFSVLVVDDGSSDSLSIKAPAPFSLQVLHLQRPLPDGELDIVLEAVNEDPA